MGWEHGGFAGFKERSNDANEFDRSPGRTDYAVQVLHADEVPPETPGFRIAGEV